VGQGERFLRRMAADGYSRSTMSRTRSVLIEAERRARREGLVTRNVAADIEVPAGTTRASKAMTVEQVGKLLALDLTPWWRAFVLTGVTAGLRPGELHGLRWEDVDFDAGVIRVRRSLKRREGTARDALVLAGLKTERSRRTQRMGKAARGALAALRREQAADRLRLGEHYADSGLVFADSAGRPSYPQQTWAGFKDLCEAAGLGRDWQPREMRHTWVSQLSQAGVDIEVIADAAGHANSNVTRGVYRHQLADEITATAAVMDQIYGASS
jgi:integrase